MLNDKGFEKLHDSIRDVVSKDKNLVKDAERAKYNIPNNEKKEDDKK